MSRPLLCRPPLRRPPLHRPLLHRPLLRRPLLCRPPLRRPLLCRPLLRRPLLAARLFSARFCVARLFTARLFAARLCARLFCAAWTGPVQSSTLSGPFAVSPQIDDSVDSSTPRRRSVGHLHDLKQQPGRGPAEGRAAPALLCALIHRSAWKRPSRKSVVAASPVRVGLVCERRKRGGTYTLRGAANADQRRPRRGA